MTLAVSVFSLSLSVLSSLSLLLRQQAAAAVLCAHSSPLSSPPPSLVSILSSPSRAFRPSLLRLRLRLRVEFSLCNTVHCIPNQRALFCSANRVVAKLVAHSPEPRPRAVAVARCSRHISSYLAPPVHLPLSCKPFVCVSLSLHSSDSPLSSLLLDSSVPFCLTLFNNLCFSLRLRESRIR